MPLAIIGGTGFYKLTGMTLKPETIETRYGPALVFVGPGEGAGLGAGLDDQLVFLARHGPDHHIPPHKINYRANISALKQLGVRRAVAFFAVGSLHAGLPPQSVVALDQFIDFSHGREGTFFDGGDSGLAHVELTDPYCAALRRQLIELAPAHDLALVPQGTYACFNGPRFETAAEVRMAAQLGGDVVGMTGVPEAPLAREAGLHYAALALSINWGAGVAGPIQIVRAGIETIRAKMVALALAALRQPSRTECDCTKEQLVIQSGKIGV